jgi:hypothetical protein
VLHGGVGASVTIEVIDLDGPTEVVALLRPVRDR